MVKIMIYKIIGASAVTLSAYLMGQIYSRTLDSYARVIGDTAKLVEYMKSEAVSRGTPLNEIVKNICRSFNGRDTVLFTATMRYIEKGELFSVAFARAVKESRLLKSEDKSLLEEFARGACVCSRSSLGEYFDGYITVLNERAERAREDGEKKGRLLKNVSVLAGAFAAVLLL